MVTRIDVHFKGRSKTIKQAGDIGKGTIDIECERDWSVVLGTKSDD